MLILFMTSEIIQRKNKMSDEQMKRFTLRIDKDLFEKIKQKAQKERRAIGKQIEYMLFNQLEPNN